MLFPSISLANETVGTNEKKEIKKEAFGMLSFDAGKDRFDYSNARTGINVVFYNSAHPNVYGQVGAIYFFGAEKDTIYNFAGGEITFGYQYPSFISPFAGLNLIFGESSTCDNAGEICGDGRMLGLNPELGLSLKIKGNHDTYIFRTYARRYFISGANDFYSIGIDIGVQL